MTYVLLAATVGLFSLQSIAAKAYQRYVTGGLTATLVFAGATGLITGVIFFIVSGFTLQITGDALLWAALGTVASMVASVCTILGMAMDNVYAVTLFMQIGALLVPSVYGVLFLKEALTPGKIAGMLLVTASLLCKLWDSPAGKAQKSTGRLRYILICLGLLFGNGFFGVTNKAHQLSVHSIPESQFTVLISLLRFAASAVLLLILMAAHKNQPLLVCAERRGKAIIQLTAPLVLFSGINGLGTLLSLRLCNYMDSSLQFPIMTAGILAGTTVLACLVYKEKLTKPGLISLLLNGAGLFALLL